MAWLVFPHPWQIDLKTQLHFDGNRWIVERLDAMCIDVGQPVPPYALNRRRVEVKICRSGTSAALDGRWLEVDQLGLRENVVPARGTG